MFERPKAGERTLLVHVQFHQHLSATDANADDLTEFVTLADSAGAEVIEVVEAKRPRPHAKYFIGSGKLEELEQIVAEHKIDLVIFNHELSPAQERNLERNLKCRVVDRTGLILDIFAQRARTFEGKLQVELAQLQHLSTRLIRGWTHLERQKGGIGLRGPGETQLESDRRLLRARIKVIRQRLQKIRNQRQQSGAKRRQSAIPVVALIGYTNAGKSTLFNMISGAEVYVQDQLFATLDPTLRQTTVPGLGPVVFVDTVGFIQDLPHDLVDAFHATLEETLQADLLLHVVDAADEHRLEKMHEVQKVLQEIGADKVPQIEVYNKIDLLEGVHPHVDDLTAHEIMRVWLSAMESATMEQLHLGLRLYWGKDLVQAKLQLHVGQGQFRSLLFKAGAVAEEEQQDDGSWQLSVSLLRQELDAIAREAQVNWQQLLL